MDDEDGVGEDGTESDFEDQSAVEFNRSGVDKETGMDEGMLFFSARS